jgi:deoxyribonuclease-4
MHSPIGAHVSIAGGIVKAIGRGDDLDCTAIQVFVKNASQWKGKPISQDEAAEFRSKHNDSPIGPIVAHATYLINLASNKPENLSKSKETLGDELDRCDLLGISGLVVHPGAHLGQGVEIGLEKIAESLVEILEARPKGKTKILLENTAGQGTLVGFRLEHLAKIRQLTGLAKRIGVCVDTCHAFAAGYPLDESTGYDDLFAELGALFGPESLGCIHMNDSKFGVGSKRDRHANLGKGEIPLGLFERLVNDPDLVEVPMILETPIGEDGDGHRRDLDLLRSLIGA